MALESGIVKGVGGRETDLGNDADNFPQITQIERLDGTDSYSVVGCPWRSNITVC
jgi:hypothetical protein